MIDLLGFHVCTVQGLLDDDGAHVFIASIGLTVRRFHDVGLNGWFLIGLFIPILNLLFFAMLYFFKSDPGTNKYGPNPYGI